MVRVSLSLIIVEMVREPSSPQKDNSTTTLVDSSCHVVTSNATRSELKVDDSMKNYDDDKLDWDATTVSLALAAFSWGYMSSQIIGGRLSELFGFKIVYGLGILIPGILMLFHPVAARADAKIFLVLRTLMGVCQGVTWPSMHTITARWVPRVERSSFIAQSYFGSTFGLIITFPMCGLIIDSYGWAVCYYVIFGITAVWSVFWFTLVYTTPSQHPRITKEERDLLSKLQVSEKALPVPWKRIVSSPPVWGTLITDCCNSWGLNTIAKYGPAYLKYMLGVDIKTNGVISGLPMIFRYIGGVIFARMSDYLQRTGRLSTLTTRRIFNTVSQVIPAVLMAILVYTGCSVTGVTIVMVTMMFFNGSISSGHFASAVDLTPNYAGTVFGLTNTLSGGAMGALVPVVIGQITKDDNSWGAWQTVFSLAAIILFTGNCFYVLLVQSEPQVWNFAYVDDDRPINDADLDLQQKMTTDHTNVDTHSENETDELKTKPV